MTNIVNEILNISLAPATVITLLFILPPLLLFRLLLSIFRSLFTEDVAGKVVLITGASSGIGEVSSLYLFEQRSYFSWAYSLYLIIVVYNPKSIYEYARRGACLALVARRQHLLQQVAQTATSLGSPDVLIIPLKYANDTQKVLHGQETNLICEKRIAGNSNRSKPLKNWCASFYNQPTDHFPYYAITC